MWLPAIGCALLALCQPAGWAASSAYGASERTEVAASLQPERLGAPTAISLTVSVAATSGPVPTPLRDIDLALPSNLGIATSGLGVAACDPAALEALGPSACPTNSRIGSGKALVEIPIGAEVREEKVTLTLFAGPSPDGYLHILICANGIFPVDAQILLTSVLLPGHLQVEVPLVRSVPGAPDVSLVRMQAVLGGHLTYYERVRGRTTAYHPPGIGLPQRCPPRGFAFAATFSFVNGSRASANTAVPCPRSHG
jgi:hypothetical protein